MRPGRSIDFQFRNHIAPRYVETLLTKLDPGTLYDTASLQAILREKQPDLDGKNIVQNSMIWWALVGMGELGRSVGGESRRMRFRLNALGKQIIDTFSTNRELALDVLHFLLYSTWSRSRDLARAKFWMYQAACDELWQSAPAKADAFRVTNALQEAIGTIFPGHHPSIPGRSVTAVFTWLGALSPPFLDRCGKGVHLCSQRRDHCAPQLFHLAADWMYSQDGINYGTSLAIGDQQIESICKVCLLEPEKFWDMADLTQSTIRGFEIRRGQWSTAIALSGPPNWISLPEYSRDLIGFNDPMVVDDEEEEEA